MLMRRADVMSRFHLGMGFSPHSAVQLCPFSRPMRTDFQTTGLYGTGYVFSRPPMPTREKNAFRANGTGLVLYIQSHCIGRRDRLVERLEAAGVSVDALGKCRNNKPNPFPWKDFEYTSFWDFEQRYKFAIGLENCRCEDYVTEKLFRRLVMGIVPIYEVGRNGRWVPEDSVLDYVSTNSNLL